MGHLPLAAWVIREVAPRIFVELGTHSANSYFSFCQSVIDGGLDTKCYAVDTWHGDEHAGHYDEDVFTAVNAHNEERYAGFSQLLRMTFDEALGCFSDESIDLLHIDGLHTYEAARHDFEVWLPKLAPGAVVMLHDTGVREQDFGVWKLWEELQAQYPNNIEFLHSHGLGILQLNDAPETRKQNWLRLDASGKERLRAYFAALGARQMERFEWNSELRTLRQQVLARDAEITNLSQAADERGGQIVDLRVHASNLDAIVADLRQHASNLETVLSTRDAQIAALRAHVSNLDAMIADLRQHAANVEMVLSTRDAQIADLTAHVSKLDVLLGDLRQHASNLERGLFTRDSQIVSLSQSTDECSVTIGDLRQQASSLTLELTARDDLIANLRREVHAVRHSTSWRITAPIRWIAEGVRKVRRASSGTESGDE
jgi:hypothetical protein